MITGKTISKKNHGKKMNNTLEQINEEIAKKALSFEKRVVIGNKI